MFADNQATRAFFQSLALRLLNTQFSERQTTRKRRAHQLEANKGPAPRPLDYKREPFATHSGEKAYEPYEY